MTPPVARDPALRVPARTCLIVAAVVLVTSLVLGSVQAALVPRKADVIYSPTAMLLTSLLVRRDRRGGAVGGAPDRRRRGERSASSRRRRGRARSAWRS